MADKDEFDPWLGRIGNRSVAGDLRRATNLAGGARPRGTGRRFTGARIGRGAATGRVLTNRSQPGPRSRRAVVKAHYVRLAGKGLDKARAHLRYLQRDGTTRDGERGTLYGPDSDTADGKAFLERGAGDRHQFRFIVAPEDGAEYPDLKSLIRRLMAQAERDLHTRLDWIAVDHFNTGHPHAHVLVRGKDERGADLVIAREYIAGGLAARAVDLLNIDLGPRTDREIEQARVREIGQERLTPIDRRLIASIDANGLVSPSHAQGVEQATRTARLRTLERLGLAREENRGQWRLDPALETTLRTLGRRGDILAMLHERLKGQRISPADYAIHSPSHAEPIVGRVIGTGLSDEEAERRYLIVESIDGRAIHIDAGQIDTLPRTGSLVSVTTAPVAARKVDHTVADIAGAHGGRYSIDIHLAHDARATEHFAQSHVRRLEAIRRATGGVEREADGSWIIASNHVERALAYEQQIANRQPVRIEMLAAEPLERLPRHDGITWLDRQLVTASPVRLGRGFGAEVAEALGRRRQWLVKQQLAEETSGQFRAQPHLLRTLERRALARTGAELSAKRGLAFLETAPGQRIEGMLRQAVQIGDTRYALIERTRDFTLVPWRPVLDRQLGLFVAGLMRRDGGMEWTLGRNRGLGID